MERGWSERDGGGERKRDVVRWKERKEGRKREGGRGNEGRKEGGREEGGERERESESRYVPSNCLNEL